MKKLNFIVVATAAALLTGCLVTSVYPFYNQKDVGFEPALLGNWVNSKSTDEHWKFEREGTNAYQFTYISDNKASVMQAHFFKLDQNSFMDLFTTQDTDVQPPPIPSHFLVRVFEVKPVPRLAALNYDWLKSFLEKDPTALRHHVLTNETNSEDTRLILTAETAELQKFILKHLKTEAAWKEDFELKPDSAEKKTEEKSSSAK
jgi:hypothetical protein